MPRQDSVIFRPNSSCHPLNTNWAVLWITDDTVEEPCKGLREWEPEGQFTFFGYSCPAVLPGSLTYTPITFDRSREGNNFHSCCSHWIISSLIFVSLCKLNLWFFDSTPFLASLCKRSLKTYTFVNVVSALISQHYWWYNIYMCKYCMSCPSKPNIRCKTNESAKSRADSSEKNYDRF